MSDRVVDSADILGGDCTVDALRNQPPLRCLLLRVELTHEARDRHQRLHVHFIVHRHLYCAAVGRVMAGLQALLHATPALMHAHGRCWCTAYGKAKESYRRAEGVEERNDRVVPRGHQRGAHVLGHRRERDCANH